MCKRADNRVLLLVEEVTDFQPIARAFVGIQHTFRPINLDKPKHQYFPNTNRFWVYVDGLIPGGETKYHTEVVLAVAAETYDQAEHGWFQLVEFIRGE